AALARWPAPRGGLFGAKSHPIPGIPRPRVVCSDRSKTLMLFLKPLRSPLTAVVAVLALAACPSSAGNADVADVSSADTSLADAVDVPSADATDVLALDVQPIDVAGRVPRNHRADNSQCLAAAPAGTCHFAGMMGPGQCRMDSDCADGGSSARCYQVPA